MDSLSQNNNVGSLDEQPGNISNDGDNGEQYS